MQKGDFMLNLFLANTAPAKAEAVNTNIEKTTEINPSSVYLTTDWAQCKNAAIYFNSF